MRTNLVVMRLADMHRVHPDQTTGRCSKCDEEVGIYPSGQRLLAKWSDIALVCQVCMKPGPSVLAPGAELEALQSKDRDG